MSVRIRIDPIDFLAPLAALGLLALFALTAGLGLTAGVTNANAQTSGSGGSLAEDTVRAVGQMLQGAAPAAQDDGGDGAAAPAGGAVTPATQVPAAMTGPPAIPGRLYARLTDDEGALGTGVRWRVYKAEPEADGSHMTVAASEEPQPVINVAPGEYVAVAVFGHAVGTSRIAVGNEPFREAVTLNAGGLRLTAAEFDGSVLPAKQVKLSIYSAEQDEFGQRKLIVENAQPGKVIVLNAGSYHVLSQYGDANATVRDDVKVETSQMTDARITHAAARVTLKLVNELGGEALANTAWSIVSPEGDVVKESFGAFPTHILASGDYSVVARHEGQIYNRPFSVQPGIQQEVEVVAK